MVASELTNIIVYPRPKLAIEELCNPTLVTIKIRETELQPYKSYQIVREVLCKHSEYFQGAFEGRFAEAEKQCIALDDVPHWVFDCFVRWIYTGSLSLEGTARAPADEDPQFWSYEILLQLYIFADKYNSKGLRILVFEHIHFRVLQHTVQCPNMPTWSDVVLIYSQLPQSSPIRRLIVEAVHFVAQDDRRLRGLDTDDGGSLDEFMADFDKRAVSRLEAQTGRWEERCKSHVPGPNDALFLWQREWCEWHEHDAFLEAKACQLRKEVRDGKKL